jgi:hypothetical protein
MNAAARLIVSKRKFDHITWTLCDDLHWLPIQQRIEYKTSLVVFKSLQQTAPGYLTEQCNFVASDPGRCRLRSAARGDLVVPLTRTKTFGPRSFAAHGPSTWNQLPLYAHALTLLASSAAH